MVQRKGNSAGQVPGSANRFERFAGIVVRWLFARPATARLGRVVGHGFSWVGVTRNADRGGQQCRIKPGRFGSAIITLVAAALRLTTSAARPQPGTVAIVAHERIDRRLVRVGLRFRLSWFAAVSLAISFGGADFAVLVARIVLHARPVPVWPRLASWRSILALCCLLSLRSVLSRRSLARAIFARGAVVAGLIEAREIAVEREVRAIVAFFAAFPTLIGARALFVSAHAAVGGHPEIVIGELQVIFGLDPVTVEVGVLRQLAIFFEQLRGIAARPAVNPVELLSAAATAAVRPIAASAPTVVVAIAVVVTAVIAVVIIIQGDSFPNPSVWPIMRLPDRVTQCHGRPLRIVVPAFAEFRGETFTCSQMLE